MQKLQSEPKNTWPKIQTIQEIAFDVLIKRGNILLSTPKQYQDEINIDEMLLFYESIILGFQDLGCPKIANFRFQIFVAATRSWEGFSLSNDGRRRFNIDCEVLCQKIKNEFLFNKEIIQQKVEITRIKESHEVLQKVKDNLLLNKEILETIVGSKLSEESICKFFAETKFYTVKYPLFTKEYVQYNLELAKKHKGLLFIDPNKLYGLSSHNGKKTFVNSQLFYDAADQFKSLQTLPNMTNNEETKFDTLTPIQKLLLTLEHDICHNIHRWYIKNKDPLLISPEKNMEIQINNKQQEAGHYYAHMAYKIYAEVSPFCINAQYRKDH